MSKEKNKQGVIKMCEMCKETEPLFRTVGRGALFCSVKCLNAYCHKTGQAGIEVKFFRQPLEEKAKKGFFGRLKGGAR